jgi:prolyl 4-hydroxylase
MLVDEVAKNIYVIQDFFTEEECDHFINESERRGYLGATINTEKGEKIVDDVRNNKRILYNDPELADKLWKKLDGSVPQKIGNSVAVGLNELFRFYRYEPGQLFKKHIDESFIRNELEASYFTFMIYLNDDYEGGETKFNMTSVKGRKGMALVFLHSLPHEGAEVKSGIKYVLRTDIMYRLAE